LRTEVSTYIGQSLKFHLTARWAFRWAGYVTYEGNSPLDSLVERDHLADLVVSGKMDSEAVEWVELAEDAAVERAENG
jgi:hypothetical protein